MAKKRDDDEEPDLVGGGHNSQQAAAGQLRAFLERRERLEEEKKTVATDIKELMAEVKGSGFDTKAFNTILKLRAEDQAKKEARQETEAIVELYKDVLGME